MIYIHIPYCRSFCTYCGFYSEIPTCGFEAYTAALCREISDRKGEINWEHNTLYIGGGTPSVLPLDVLRRIVEALRSAREATLLRAGQKSASDGESEAAAASDGTFTGSTGARNDGNGGKAKVGGERWSGFEEFTVEVNPDDIVKRGTDYVRGLKGLGVNRISMGVQSLDYGVLKWMNRRHNAEQARMAYKIIRGAGIDNISVDLIFGFGSMESLPETINGILDLGGDGMPPRHISAYQLSVEPESELAQMVVEGRYIPASDELCARQYEMLCARLAAAGYRHYEISNFAQPGYESRHNSAYWKHVPYIGFGPAAHSLLIEDPPLPRRDEQGAPPERRKYVRRWNKADINAYLSAGRTEDWDSVSESEILTPAQIREERIMLSLRTDEGIDLAELNGKNPDEGIDRLHLTKDLSSDSSPTGNKRSLDEDGKALEARVSAMIQNGSLEIQGSRVRIPENRFFVSDDIISDLI